MPTPEQVQRREKLVDALRSGNYKQTKGMLRDYRDGYCCLGVACDVSGLGHWSNVEQEIPGDWHYIILPTGEHSMSALPNEVRKYYGFATVEGELTMPHGYHRSLAAQNDAGVTFDEIAAIIEAGDVREQRET